MAVLDSVLIEEHSRLQRMCIAMEKEVLSLPKGYLSKKVIDGKPYYYLQRREGKKVIGQYISSVNAEKLRPIIARRQGLEKSIRECKSSMKKLEKLL